MAKWMVTDANEWSTHTMKQFILFQNSYSYDGNEPIKHSANALIKFASMEDEKQIAKFIKVYAKLYPVKKVVSAFVETSRGGKLIDDAVLIELLNGYWDAADYATWDARCIELFGEVADVVFTNREEVA